MVAAEPDKGSEATGFRVLQKSKRDQHLHSTQAPSQTSTALAWHLGPTTHRPPSRQRQCRCQGASLRLSPPSLPGVLHTYHRCPQFVGRIT